MPVVLARSTAYTTWNSSGSEPPSSLYVVFRLKPLAIRCDMLACGNRSPATCSNAKRSNGILVLNALITQSRYNHIDRLLSFS